MIATKKPLKQAAAESDRAAALAEQPKPDEPIKSKKPRLRGRARADAAKHVATVEGPKSKRPLKLAPGVKLIRQYKGEKIVVLVIDEKTFEYQGKRYGSLSKLACEISKSHCSGPRWFGLGPKDRKSKKDGAR
jgi:hypothetical protein